MSFTLSLIGVMIFVVIAYVLIFSGLLYLHGRPNGLAEMFDSIPRTRTVILCILYPGILVCATIHGICAFAYQGSRHGYQHLRAIVVHANRRWLSGIKSSITLHDRVARDVLRAATKAGFGSK